MTKAEILAEAVRGVELTPLDERMVAWLCRADAMTVEAIADLMERVRVAALDAELAPAH